MITYLAHEIYNISTVTDGEYVRICASFTAMANQEYNCGTCLLKYKDEARQLKSQKAKGCWSVSENPINFFHFETLRGMPKIKFYKCIGNFVSPYFKTLINEADFFEKGIFHYPGTLNDQPAKFVEVMNLIHNLKRDYESEINKKVNRGK